MSVLSLSELSGAERAKIEAEAAARDPLCVLVDRLFNPPRTNVVQLQREAVCRRKAVEDQVRVRCYALDLTARDTATAVCAALRAYDNRASAAVAVEVGRKVAERLAAEDGDDLPPRAA